MFLGILSESIGKYALYTNLLSSIPHIDTGASLIIAAGDIEIHNDWDSSVDLVRYPRLQWSYLGTACLTVPSHATVYIKPETHGSIYLFGSQRLCDFAAGYFAAYNGADVSSIYNEIASHFQDPSLGSYLRLMPKELKC